MLPRQVFTYLLLISALFTACGKGSETGAEGKIHLAYDVLTTSGGDSIFQFGELGAINRGLIGLIDRITDSSRVHIAIFNWTITQVADRLIKQLKAHPGAHCRIILDPHNFRSKHPAHRQALNDKLRNFEKESGQLVIENDHNVLAGLLNTNEASRRPRIMHNKFFLFSKLSPSDNDDGQNTVAISSANLSYAEVGESNEMVVIHGDKGLYERFLDYWNAMAESRNDYTFKTTHTYSHVHDHFAMFYPKNIEGDEVVNILRTLLEAIQSTHKPCKIRIAMSIWHKCRKEIAEVLLKLYNDFEVDIKILLKEDLDISPIVHDILSELPAGTVRFLPSRHPQLHYGLHSKMMLIDGPFPLAEGGEAERQRLSFTGSHNWNLDAHRYNSETWIRIADREVHSKLEAHWEEMWQKAVDSTDIYENVKVDSSACW